MLIYRKLKGANKKKYAKFEKNGEFYALPEF